jgi:hypothetical protein
MDGLLCFGCTRVLHLLFVILSLMGYWNVIWMSDSLQEVLGINISHTGGGVWRLNKKFEGQIFFGSDFNFVGPCSLILLCFVLIHFQLDVLRPRL